MKQIISCICFLLLIEGGFAQDLTTFAKDSKVFVENSSKNENAAKTTGELVNRLNEWAYWNVVDSPEDADFKINVDISVSKGITATSWGGTSYELTAKLIDGKDKIIWESNTYKASPNGTNGFNAGKAVVKKLMRDLRKKFKSQ